MKTCKGKYYIHDECFDIQYHLVFLSRSEQGMEIIEETDDYREEPGIIVTDETEAGIESEIMPIGGEISEEIVYEDPVVENLPDDVVLNEEDLTEDEMAEVVNELQSEQTATEEYFNQENIDNVAID